MNNSRPWSWQLQHVVFPGDARRRSQARNLKPSADDPPADDPVPPPAPAETADPFVAWLFAQAGLSAAHYRVETLRRRLPACLRMLRARSPAHARQILEQSPGRVAAAVSALLVGVTAFFRDPDSFALLRALLPDLAGRRPGIQVWSAGCSDGGELYSVALLLAEAGLLAGSFLLGTDCRPDALRTARAGRYDTPAIRAVPPTLLRQYFEFRDGAWEVDGAVRRAIRWRAADVLTTPEPGVWDVVLFRNTAMYMRAEAAYPLWERFEQALRPGGLLVLGKAERPGCNLGRVAARLTPVGPCVFRRTRG